MGEASQEPVLRRKVGARRASLGLAEMTPAKAMRLALAKVGDAVLQVPVGLRDLKVGTLTPENLQETLPDPALLLQLEGENEAVGLAVVCPQAVAAVIEAQTRGRISEGDAPDRKPTATDASLTRSFAEQVLGAFALLAEDCNGLPALDGYRVSGRIPDARVAAMVIEDTRHNHFVVDVDFASGAKSGAFHYVLPNRPAAARRADKNPSSLADQLDRAVLASKVALDARLCTLTLPLSVVKGLHVGQELPLNETTRDSVTLRAMNDAKIFSGRLGRAGPMRAIRLRDGDAPPALSGQTGTALMSPTTAAGAAVADLGGDPFAEAGADLGAFGDAGAMDLDSLGDAALPDMPDLPGAAPMDSPDALPAMGGELDMPGLDTTSLDDLPDTLDPLPLSLD